MLSRPWSAFTTIESYMMDVYPRQLDGADVLRFAPAIPGQQGVDYDSGGPVPIIAYAFAQYSGYEPQAYLFAVSADHRVVAETLWESPDWAMDVAEDSGFVEHGTWKRLV